MQTVTQLLEPRAPESRFQREATARLEQSRAVFDALAPERQDWRDQSGYYYQEVTKLVRFLIPEGASVLELGAGTGDLLAALEPSRGLGIDFSPGMVEEAQRRHAGNEKLEFRVGEAERLDLGEETFDYVVLSDLIVHLEDVWLVFRRLQAVCRPETRIVITTHSALWEPALTLAERLGWKMPTRPHSWLGHGDIRNLLHLNHFEVVSEGSAVLCPQPLPGAGLLNRVGAQLPGLKALNLVLYTVARPAWRERPPEPEPLKCSVIVPTRNERGNVDDIFARTPEMGLGTELVFVDGNSDDGTWEEIENRLESREATLMRQPGKGKGDAVRAGFEAATGDIYFILDSDLTVPPEDLPKFYLAAAEGRGEFINGTRLVYPMEDEAMRFLNLYGNKFFSVFLSLILGQRLKDTLCGTKVVSSRNYQKISDGRHYFGDFDPFGDFDLIFGAAKQQLKIVEIPVRYRARTYGETKISRFRHGFLLLRMSALALWKFKLARES